MYYSHFNDRETVGLTCSNQELIKLKNQDSSPGQCDCKAHTDFPKETSISKIQNAFGTNKFTSKKSKAELINRCHQNHVSVKSFSISPEILSKERVFHFK